MNTTHTMTTYARAIVIVLVVLISLAAPLTLQALSIVPAEGALESFPASKNWALRTHLTFQYAANGEVFRHTLGGEALRRRGYLPLVGDTNKLYIYDARDDRLYATGYELPLRDWCNGCATSASMQHPGLVTLKDGKIVTTKNGNVYLYDPEVHRASFVYSGEAIEEYVNFAVPVAVDNEIYLYTNKKWSVNDQEGYYRIDPFEGLVLDTEVEIVFDHATPQVPGPHALMVTDYIGEGSTTAVGQVNTGVYVSTHAGLTKLGYTDRVSRTDTDYTTLKEPRLLSRTHVAWIGVDQALYIGEINHSGLNRENMTGILDVPRRVPFGVEGSPHIYYHDYAAVTSWYSTEAYYHFEDEQDYYDVLGVDHFRDVIWLPAGRFDASVLSTQEAERGEEYEHLFRAHVRKEHRD